MEALEASIEASMEVRGSFHGSVRGSFHNFHGSFRGRFFHESFRRGFGEASAGSLEYYHGSNYPRSLGLIRWKLQSLLPQKISKSTPMETRVSFH